MTLYIDGFFAVFEPKSQRRAFVLYRILIVEDDAVIAAAVKKHLENWGMEALCAQDFQDVMHTFLQFQPHLVLLDLALPCYNGYHWCAEIRRVSTVPVVFLSSASDNMNIVMAMNMGGDDFIAKPFDLDVLLAKVQAVLRRSYDLAESRPALSHRGATLDLSDATLTYRGQKIELTKNDYRILQALMENRGRIISRAALMERLWATDSYVDENTLSVSVARLRKKLEAAGLTDFITTKKGLGYIVE